MNDLEVEDRLALRFFRRAPRRIALDCHQWVVGRQAEFGRELVEIGEVRQVVDLGKDDGDAGTVETSVAERLQVVEGDHVGGRHAPGTDRICAIAPKVVQARDAGHDGGDFGWQERGV